MGVLVAEAVGVLLLGEVEHEALTLGIGIVGDEVFLELRRRIVELRPGNLQRLGGVLHQRGACELDDIVGEAIEEGRHFLGAFDGDGTEAILRHRLHCGGGNQVAHHTNRSTHNKGAANDSQRHFLRDTQLRK